MIEKGKISAFQMGVMMYPTIIATGIIALPSIMGKYAKNDLWLSPIWASLIGFLTVYIVSQLHNFYPKQTIIQYSEHILGRILGKVIAFFYIFYLLQLNSNIVRIYADFIVGVYLIQTPISVVISTILVVSALAVRGGVEVVGRVAELFVPVFIFSLVVIIILVLPNLEPQNLFPILEHGIKPSMIGAVSPQGWFGEFLLMSFLLPFLTDGEKGRKWGMISVFAIMLTMVVTNLVILFLFGGDTASFLYPVLEAAEYISIADFFENLESIIMAMWVLGVFVKISVFYYAAAVGTAQWLNLSDYRPIVWPLGFLVVLFSFWDIPNKMVLSRWDVVAFPFYGLLFQTLLPLLLLLIAVIRIGKWRKRDE